MTNILEVVKKINADHISGFIGGFTFAFTAFSWAVVSFLIPLEHLPKWIVDNKSIEEKVARALAPPNEVEEKLSKEKADIEHELLQCVKNSDDAQSLKLSFAEERKQFTTRLENLNDALAKNSQQLEMCSSKVACDSNQTEITDNQTTSYEFKGLQLNYGAPKVFKNGAISIVNYALSQYGLDCNIKIHSFLNSKETQTLQISKSDPVQFVLEENRYVMHLVKLEQRSHLCVVDTYRLP